MALVFLWIRCSSCHSTNNMKKHIITFSHTWCELPSIATLQNAEYGNSQALALVNNLISWSHTKTLLWFLATHRFPSSVYTCQWILKLTLKKLTITYWKNSMRRLTQTIQERYAQTAQTSADLEDPDFGLWTPGSEAWSGSPPKLYHLVLEPCPTPPRNFVTIRSQVCE